MKDADGSNPAMPEPLRGGDAGGRPSPKMFERGAEWLRGGGEAADVVLSTRVRLARNLAGFPFQPKAAREDRLSILRIAKERILALAGEDEAGGGLGGELAGDLARQVMWIDLHETPRLERTLLTERHLISKPHARGKLASGEGGPDAPRAVAIGLPSERLSIMVNEEDHLRIQLLRSGLVLSRCLREIDVVDDRLEGGLDFAFNPRFGYLTACPTNVGTGIRFGVMLHLPALAMTGEIEKVKRAADDMYLAVRGAYGEGSESAGDLYQVSNQTTLGKTEPVLLHELEREIVPRIIDYERQARRTLMEKRRDWLEDSIFRALGVLRCARLLAAEETMGLLSKVRLGVVLGLLERGDTAGVQIDAAVVHRLMLLTQPAHLQKAVGRELNQHDRRVERARVVRQALAGG